MADALEGAKSLIVYYCPICKVGTGDRAWHPVGRAGLIPQTQDEHTCVKVDVLALVADLEALERRVDAFRACAWDHLIQVNDDTGVTASGYGPTDIPDELLIDAIVDESAERDALQRSLDATKAALTGTQGVRDDYKTRASELLQKILDEPCEFSMVSSRVCERGTRSCIVYHTAVP